MSNEDIRPPEAEGAASIYSPPESDTSFAPTGDLFSVYVGPNNADYYASRFARISDGHSTSWHWPAFFFSAFWFLYRKMWLNALLYWAALPSAMGGLTALLSLAIGDDNGSLLGNLVFLFIAFVIVPMYANLLYYKHVEAKVKYVTTAIPSPEKQAAELARTGGTSNVALVIALLFAVIMIGIFAAIVIPMYQDLVT